MTASAWLAVGTAIAALGAPAIGPLLVALLCAVGGPTALALAAARPRVGRWSLPLLLGATALALRLVVFPAAGAAADPSELPEGRGPWSARVVALSSNRDGQQIAQIALDLTRAGRGPGPPVLVAATLPRYPPIEPGLIVSVDGALQSPPDGPYGDYLARIGVAATLRSRTLSVVGRADGPGSDLERVRRAAGDALAAAIPEPEAGLAAGIVIGLRDRVDRDLAADFTAVGASHVVAISGWNIAIVAATVAALAGRFGRRARSAILVPAVLSYVVFAGASPSVVRAAAMAMVVLLARESGRAGRATAALGWAATILLVAEPALIRDAGFQLSTLATAGILAWADPLETRLSAWARGRLPDWLAESLAVSLAAQAATLPVVLATFGRLALIAPALNLAIVPLIAPAMAAALVALVGGALALAGAPGALATVLGLPAWALLTAVVTIVRAGAALPFASVAFEPPWTWVTATLSVVLPWSALRLRRWHVRRWRQPRSAPRATSPLPPAAAAVSAPTLHRSRAPGRRAAAVAVTVVVASLALGIAHRPDGTTRITVLDVGQGDAILVEGGRGGRMLVDGGPDPDRLLVELDRRLPPWDRRLDIVILTHPHEDHVAGLPLLLARYRVGRLYESGMRGPGPGYAALAAIVGPAARPSSSRPSAAVLAAGARIGIDDISLRVLWPDPGRVPREPPDDGRAINDVSIVLLGEVAGRRFLLTGDVEDDVDPILAARGLPPIDILKVAHHGSATASSAAFLAGVRPRVAIVSAGAGNRYGHPARSTVERLAATGARVLRTDTDGSVAVTINSRGVIQVVADGPRRSTRTEGPAVGRPVGRTAIGQRPALPMLPAPLTVAPAVAFGCGIPSGA